MQIPRWAEKIIDEKEAARVEAAVAQAEKITSAEIVPVVVPSSLPLFRIKTVTFFIFLFLFEALGLLLENLWVTGFLEYVHYVSMPLSALLAWGLARLPFWVRLLTFQSELRSHALVRAELEFYRQGINRTAGAVGILILVSYHDHEVVVLADKSISAQYDYSTWQLAVQKVIEGFQSKKFSEGLAQAVLHCAEAIKDKFPMAKLDRNELSDRLIIHNS